MYLSSPNLQSPLAIKKMQDRVVNILLSHLVGKNECQKLSWNIRTTAGNSGLPLSLYFYTEVQPLCKHFDISAWLDFENVPALYKINALEEGKYFFHIHFQLLDQVWTLYVGLHDSFLEGMWTSWLWCCWKSFLWAMWLCRGFPRRVSQSALEWASAPALCGSGAMQWREPYSRGNFVHTVGDHPEQAFRNQLKYHL